jgi:hypothetical protein
VVEFKSMSSLLGNQYPELDVCSNNGTSIKVFQWQPQGVLDLDNDRGIKYEDAQFLEKARNFIQIAKEKHSDLVLTPEYSFPYTVLTEVINDRTKWPEQGKLWCLGTQGESRERFISIISEWKTSSDLNVIDYAYANDNLNIRSFVCPLFYLFLAADGKLCIVPQFKTVPMADARLSFEGVGLCIGRIIFFFESTVQECKNVFLSLICADAIGINSTQIFNEVKKTGIILFNPQLNPKPRCSNMLTLRDELINNQAHQVRILTLNWSENTRINNTSHKFMMPWSAFYKYSNGNKLTNNRSQLRTNKENNHKNGTGYALNGFVEIWFSKRYEHTKLFFIRKSDNGTLPRVLTTGDEPKTEECLVFDETKAGWVLDQNSCMTNVGQLYNLHNILPDFLYPTCQNRTGSETCDKCYKCDWFFGSLLGHFESGEIETKSEVVHRMLVGSDCESDRQRAEMLGLIADLKRNLDNGNIPEALNYFKDNNYQLFVPDNFPELGMKIINMRPIKKPEHSYYPEALVLITKMNLEDEVEVLLKELMYQQDDDYRNQIIIYYKPVMSAHSIYYDKHLKNTSYQQPEFSDGLTSIRNPRTALSWR